MLEMNRNPKPYCSNDFVFIHFLQLVVFMTSQVKQNLLGGEVLQVNAATIVVALLDGILH